jgi:membrane protein implicated in regulation of membrane protease activity
MPEDLRRRDRLIGLFLLALMLLNPPLLLLFGRGSALFGLPLLYVYLFAAWLAVIAAVAWIAEGRALRRRRDEESRP